MFLFGFLVVAQYFPCAKKNNNCISVNDPIYCGVSFSTENGTVQCFSSNREYNQFYDGVDGVLQHDQSEVVDTLCGITGFSSLTVSFETFPIKQEIQKVFSKKCVNERGCADKFQCQYKRI